MRASITVACAIVVIFTLTATPGFAQRTTGGIKGGLNLARFSGDDAGDDQELLMGYCAGVFIAFNLGDTLAIQPEILYTVKGTKLEAGGIIFNETAKATTEISYLEIPLLLKLSMSTEGSIIPRLFVGPAAAVKLDAKAKFEYAGISEEEDIENIKDVDFGLVAGAGFDIGVLTVEARYTLGLVSINDTELEEIDIRNSVFSVMAGFSF